MVLANDYRVCCGLELARKQFPLPQHHQLFQVLVFHVAHVRFGSTAEVGGHVCDVCFTPNSGSRETPVALLLSATTGQQEAARNQRSELANIVS
jgi:hypothetical protein